MALTISNTFEKTTDSVQQALTDLRALNKESARVEDELIKALQQVSRMRDLLGDPDAFRAFLRRPYLTRPLGEGKYELILPKFSSFRAGWPLREDGEYLVFLVTRFTHFMSPLPGWLASELNFGAPSFRGTMDDEALVVSDGDPKAVFEKLGGERTFIKVAGNRLFTKPASRFDLLRRIIREEGFLPFTPKPVASAIKRPLEIALDEDGHPAFTLRPHQTQAFETFLLTGAISLFAYPQTGKSFVALYALAALHGPKLILCPRRTLVEQWKARLALYLTEIAASEVTVATYQGAGKFIKDQSWTLVVWDEAHHLPADFAIESASTIQTDTRMALSATPEREDGQAELIPALGGWPVGYDWPIKAIQRPTVTVWIVNRDDAKLKLMRRLMETPTEGHTLIFTWRLDIGKRASRMLKVPFVHGQTKQNLKTLIENEVVVVSSVGNEGLSLPASRIIELSFQFGSRMEAGQRLGRLAYEVEGRKEAGEHHVLMTAEEYQKYNKRLLVYEQWGLNLDVRTAEGDSANKWQRLASGSYTIKVKGYKAPASLRPFSLGHERKSVDKKPTAADPKPTALPLSETDQIIDSPAVRAKLTMAAKTIDPRSSAHLTRLLRFVWDAPLSVDDILLGLGQTGAATKSRYGTALRALTLVGLTLKQDGEGVTRYAVNHELLKRLSALSGLRDKR